MLKRVRGVLGDYLTNTILALLVVGALIILFAAVVTVFDWMKVPQPLATYVAVAIVFGGFFIWYGRQVIELAFVSARIMWPLVLICSLIGAFIDAWRGGLWGALAGFLLAAVIGFVLQGRSYRRA